MLLINFKSNNKTLFVTVLFAFTITFISTSVYSKPPPWAPAHGYRNKQHGGHHHYNHLYADIIGIFDGKCNYEKIGTVVGGATGAVIGSKAVDKKDKVVGVIAGTVIGAIIGKVIGRAIDERDRQCTAQALEYAEEGQTIEWHNSNTKIDYAVTPINSYQSGGRDCKLFLTKATLSNGQVSSYESDACLHVDGVWRTFY